MKLLLLLLLPISLHARTHYVHSDRSLGDGLDSIRPWSFSQLNVATLIKGDTILLKRGESYYGTLQPRSGVYYGAYGVGRNPMITGLTDVKNWVSDRKNLFHVDLAIPSLNVVVLDDLIQGMGRFPNVGYLPYTGHVGNASITAESALPFDIVGSEIVIRKIRQVTDRQFVTSVHGKTMNLSSAGAFGTPYLNNTSNQPNDGNGFFIQSHIATLDKSGEWYFDAKAKRLYMYFSDNEPAQHKVQVSSLDRNIEFNNMSDLQFESIDFEGANVGLAGSSMNNIRNIKFVNCNISRQQNGIVVDNGCDGLTVSGSKFTDILNNAIFTMYSENVTIDNCDLTNIGFIAGAGASGSGSYLAIWIIGDNSVVKDCRLKNIGFHGIVLHGNSTIIERNFIDTFGFVKDDCGGIYDFQFEGILNQSKSITKNIVLNAIGAIDGCPPNEKYGQAAGIYLDVATNNCKVEGNTVAHGPWGGILLLGIGENISLHRNLTYDVKQGLLIYNYPGMLIRKLVVTKNQFVAKHAFQFPLYLEMSVDDAFEKFGTFNANHYARPIDDNLTIGVNRNYMGAGGMSTISLPTWKMISGQDRESLKSPLSFSQFP